MHKLSLQRWKGAEKELQLLQHVWHIELQCVYSPNSPWSDQWVQFICGFWQTQKSSHPFYPKDTLTLLFCEGAEGMRGEESFQQLQRQFHWARAAFHSLHCYSVYEIIWVWTWILWASGPGPSICRGGNVRDGQGPHQFFFKRALFIKKQKQNWYLSSCCPVRLFCCYNVASVCCQLQHQHPPHTIKPQSPWWCTWHRYQHHKHIHKQTQSQNKQNPTVSLDSLFVFCRSVYSN